MYSYPANAEPRDPRVEPVQDLHSGNHRFAQAVLALIETSQLEAQPRAAALGVGDDGQIGAGQPPAFRLGARSDRRSAMRGPSGRAPMSRSPACSQQRRQGGHPHNQRPSGGLGRQRPEHLIDVRRLAHDLCRIVAHVVLAHVF